MRKQVATSTSTPSTPLRPSFARLDPFRFGPEAEAFLRLEQRAPRKAKPITLARTSIERKEAEGHV